VPVVCVLTRFGLRSPRHLLPTYRDFRRVQEQARSADLPGLLQSALLVESPTTLYSLSIWSDMTEIGFFGTEVTKHVDAARRVFGRLAYEPDRGPELWSTKWRLATVSNNLNWAGAERERLLAGPVR